MTTGRTTGDPWLTGSGRPARQVRAALPLVVPGLLVLLAFLQSPGRLTFDTDIGLALDPVHLLRRAAHLWQGEAGFGGLGNQAYGFLFPMGPFFALGDLAGLPAWVVQRAWSAVLLVLAYEGARRLVLAMIARSSVVAVLAGLAWALSPRMLTVVGPFSSEALPVALAPWLLLPLVLHLERDVRRAAWLSGVVVLGLGAVNAAATLAVLPIPLLYLLTRTVPWRRRARALGWWSGAVVLASLWWVGPLLLLGAYSPPFTDWVESASTTTGPVSALAALRGATDWVGYVPSGGGGFWPAAWALSTSRPLAVATVLVAVLGLAGLTSRRCPERRYLVLTALVGFALLTVGHAGSPGSPVSGVVRDLLDGPASPFRNVYKFDPVLRLPLLLGLAHLLARLQHAPRPRPVARRAVRPVAWVVAAGLIVVCALPALQGQLRPGPAFEDVPQWWTSAAEHLASDVSAGRTLVVPGAATGRYTWGRTIGEPLESLARSPWAVRSQVPLTQPGNTRLIDAVQAVLSTGRGSPALADVLAQAGVGQLLVRNDLESPDAVPPVRIRQALQRSPGLRLVRQFGQRSAAAGPAAGGAVDAPALEVWAVDRPVAGARTVPVEEVAVLSGGPEDLLMLHEAGLLEPDGATVLTDHTGAGVWPGPRLITDGLQRRERSFGRVKDATGPLLTADDPFRQVRAAHDLLPAGVEGPQTVAAYDRLASITASSSAAFPDSFGGVRSGTGPAAALDGDLGTAWNSGALRAPVGEWLEVQLEASTDAPTVALTLVSDPQFGPAVTSVRLDTEAGSVVRPVAANENPQVVELPPGRWSRLRVTVESVAAPSSLAVVGIRELALPGPPITRTVVAPSVLPQGPRPAALAFGGIEATEPCLVTAGLQACDPRSADRGEEHDGLDRTFTLPDRARYTVTGTVLPGRGPEVSRLLGQTPSGLVATANTALGAWTAVGPAAVVDGDPSTAWVAALDQPRPAVTVSWPEPTAVSEAVLVPADRPGTAAPTRVAIRSAAGDREAAVAPDGTVRFPPLVTTSLTFEVLAAGAASPTGPSGSSRAPVAVAEVRLPDVAAAPSALPDAAATGAVCGFGPELVVDGTSYDTQVTGTVADLRSASPLQVSVCGAAASGIELGAGTHRVRLGATAEFSTRSIVLTPDGGAGPGADGAREVTVQQWGPVDRALEVDGGGASLLVVPEAANAGWQAVLGGRELEPVMVDGWQQGWWLPAGGGGRVDLVFTPDRPYRLSLAAGAVAAGVLLALAVAAVRRPDREREAPAPTAPVDHRRATTRWVVLLAVLCAVVGGWLALGAFLLLALAVLAGRPVPVAVACWASVLAAGILLGLDTSRGVIAVQSGATAQTLSLVAVAALAALALRPSARTGRADA